MEWSIVSRKLYVGNLPYETSETDLETLFAEAGAVESVNVIRDRETGRARGFAFVEMVTEDAARQAVSQLHDRDFGGRRLTVNEAKPQVPRSGGFNRGPSRRSEPRW
jgi:RNA recognition motif-containing protein